MKQAPYMSLLLMSTACSPALHRVADASEIVAHASLACDGMSTHDAMRRDDVSYVETNPMIAGKPSDGALVGYFGFVGGAVFVANRAVDSMLERHGNVASVLRVVMNAAVLAVEVDSVQFNREQGVSTCGL